ncbi:MAG: biotin-dependent carboxyltransferase family protein [Mesorhizobium sp.]
MGILRVLVAGARTMVQDSGFRNARGQGVPACGVLDRQALVLVNALLGNPAGTEALEIALLSPTLRAESEPVRLALSGTLRGAVHMPDGTRRSLSPWTATTLLPGDELHLSPPERGGNGLVGIQGGLDLPIVLGSRSTCQRAGFGGLSGRPLQAGDALSLRQTGPVSDAPDFQLNSPPEPFAGPIRVVPGPQSEWFTSEEFARFLASRYVLSPKCDRMGLRLEGPALSFAPGFGGDIISDGIAPGAIQVPGNGMPIILLADAQTMGGYPKIATVISADLSRLAARIPGDEIRFQAITVEQAEAVARADQAALARAILSIGPAVGTGWRQDDLHGVNLISGVVDMCRPDHFPGHLFPHDEEPAACV